MDPRHVRRAAVLKAGVPAARLERVDNHVRFEYLPEYLDAGGERVATTLELTERPVDTVGGAVPPFFAGLLPEGRRLTALRRAVKTSADDELSLLLAVGEDLVGDVQVLAEGAPPVDHPRVVTDESWSDLDFAALAVEVGIDPSALAGVQDKVSGRLLTIPMIHQGRAHLLKLTPPEYPSLVENEAYFLGIARRLRQPVVASETVVDRAGRTGLLITRFDRVAERGVLRRRAVEDGAQLLGRYPADKYNVTTEEVLDVLTRTCAAALPTARSVLQQVALAWLTGNGDLHAKNISVVASPAPSPSPPAPLSPAGHSAPVRTEWRLAPIYDIPSTAPYGDTTMALSLGGRLDGWSRRRMLAFATAFGLPTTAAESALAEVLTATETMIDEIASSALPFDATRTRHLVRLLRARRRALEPDA